jgi:hypothetical protein
LPQQAMQQLRAEQTICRTAAQPFRIHTTRCVSPHPLIWGNDRNLPCPCQINSPSPTHRLPNPARTSGRTLTATTKIMPTIMLRRTRWSQTVTPTAKPLLVRPCVYMLRYSSQLARTLFAALATGMNPRGQNPRGTVNISSGSIRAVVARVTRPFAASTGAVALLCAEPKTGFICVDRIRAVVRRHGFNLLADGRENRQNHEDQRVQNRNDDSQDHGDDAESFVLQSRPRVISLTVSANSSRDEASASGRVPPSCQHRS